VKIQDQDEAIAVFGPHLNYTSTAALQKKQKKNKNRFYGLIKSTYFPYLTRRGGGSFIVERFCFGKLIWDVAHNN
jgi:hypothetical protein